MGVACMACMACVACMAELSGTTQPNQRTPRPRTRMLGASCSTSSASTGLAEWPSVTPALLFVRGRYKACAPCR